MSDKFKGYKIPQSFDEIDPERKEYIKKLAEDEFYGSHPEYVYCENDNGYRKYILKDQLSKYATYHQISDDKLDILKKNLLKLKLKSRPLSPIGIALKDQIISELEEADRIRKIEAGIELPKIKTERKPTPFIKRIPFVYIILFALSLPSIGYMLLTSSKYGHLKIISKSKIVSVQIDSKNFGFKTDSANILVYDVPIGLHLLKVKLIDGSVYKSNINVHPDNLLLIEIDNNNLSKNNVIKNEKGFIYFRSNLNEFKTFIDNEELNFKNNWIPVSTGEHSFRVSREGYRSQPSFRSFLIAKQDSIELRFTLIKNNEIESTIDGTLEINSNVRGASIFINNKNTNYTTDHIFNGLNAGQYTVEIKKEGFKVLNNNQTITINNANQSNALYFNLEQNSATVKIRTEGQKGIIYLDSKQVGIETFEKNLNFGNYTVSFNEIDNYITPRAINLSIYETKNYNYSVTYIPIIRYEANIISNSFKSSDFTFRFGYAQFGRFVEDKEHGPKFVTDKNGKSVLEFSFPFEYNNPKGGHALKFNFSLPRTFYNSQHIVLKLAVFYTDENYSLIGQGDPRITLIVNNHRQLNNIKLTNKRETTQGYPTQDFVINSYLRTGDNEIILYLPDANTSFIQLQHIYLGQ